MQKKYIYLVITILLTLSFTVFSADINLKKDFNSLVNFTLKHNPDIKSAAYEVKKIMGAKIQTGKFLNPQLDFEVENFGGSLPGSTFNSSESTISLSQEIEIGGKRKYRKQAANYKVLAAKENYKILLNQKIFELFYFYNKTTESFKQLALAKDMEKLSKDVFFTIKEKVKYGKSSPVEEVKAQLELKRAELKLNEAQYIFNKFEKLMISLTGVDKLPFNIDYYFLNNKYQLKSKEDYKSMLLNSPQLEEIRFLELSGSKELKLAKSQNIPNLNFSIGYRKFRENEDKAYVASVGVKLPIFNRNKGLIMEKGSEKNIATQLLKKKEIQLNADFENYYKEMIILKDKHEQYENVMVKGARQAYEAVLTGYKAGKFNYLDMLDSMRTLIEVENENIKSIAEYNEAIGNVERITGNIYKKYEKLLNSEKTNNKRGEK